MSRGPGADGTAAIRRPPLRLLLAAVGWDLRLQVRYQIVTVAVAATLLYVAIFRAIPAVADTSLLVLLIFSDPTMLGFLFVGVLVLFERGAKTLEAVVVTPLSSAQYLLSKAISLTVIALPCGVAMAAAGRGAQFDLLALSLAIVLSSLLFVFIGVVAVARVHTVNEYLLIVPLFLAPLNVPVAGLIGGAEPALFYLIPTQASLVLFQRAFAPRPLWELFYGVGVLTLSIAGSFAWARRSFERRVRAPGGPR